jgi:cell division protein FtsQ
MKIKSWIVKALIFLMIGCSVYALMAAVDLTMQRQTEVIVYKITGDKEFKAMVSEDDLKAIMDREFNELMVGTTVSEVDVRAVEDRLQAEPYLEKVSVFLDVKGVLNIEVKPRNALFRVLPSKGLSYYVDEHGISFPTSRYYTPRVQIITGNVPDYRESRQVDEDGFGKFDGLVEVMKFIQKDEFLSAQIEEVYVDRKGRLELVPKVGEHRILYGSHSQDDMGDRFENLKIFYKEGLPYEGWNKYKTINIEFKGQVVCSTDKT